MPALRYQQTYFTLQYFIPFHQSPLLPLLHPMAGKTCRHFHPAWSGNGLDQMNFYALTSTLDGPDLGSG